MNNKSTTKNIISWIFGVVFLVTGILNAWLVHFVPGVFYLLLSLIYFPPASAILKKRFGFAIPYIVKIVLGLVILWMTLAVGDLMEMLEAWLGH